jgi:hypothetical protein
MKLEELEQNENKDLAGALEEYRVAARDVSRSDEGFWERQRLAVMTRVGRRQPVLGSRQVLAWGMAAIIVLVVIGLRLEVPQALPAPDIAGGYDQELLDDVDRLLHAAMPSALEPAMILVRDINAGSGTPASGVSPESQLRK